MPGHAPISDTIRLRIAELADDGLSVRAVAAELKVAPSTVTRAARRMGIKFDRAAVAAASEVRKIDAKAKRVLACERAITEAGEVLNRLHLPYRLAGVTNSGVHEKVLPRPPAAEALAIVKTYSLLINTHIKLAEVDMSDDSTDHARSMLGRLADQLNRMSDVDQWLDHLTSGDSEEAAKRES